jgi:foldase protein PrsA
MRSTSRYTQMLTATFLVAAGLAACGGGGSDPVVAQVDGVGSITTTTLDHWIPVEAAVLYQEVPLGPIPKGVLPDPPSYTACIAFLRSYGSKLVENGAKQTTAQLKSRCEQQLHKLKVLTLNTLIDWDWILGAGASLGMKVTAAEIQRRFIEVNDRLFPQKAELPAYMEHTGQTVGDLMYRAKVQLFEVKEAARLTAATKALSALSAQQREAALRKLYANQPPNKQWAAKTSCRQGFVTSDCKQYKGSEAPGYPN